LSVGTEGLFRPSEALGALGVVCVPMLVGRRGGLVDRADNFCGLGSIGDFTLEVWSLFESCLAVIPIYLLALDPADIFDCASREASALVTLRFRASVGEVRAEAP
jgi:hypothetical protein